MGRIKVDLQPADNQGQPDHFDPTRPICDPLGQEKQGGFEVGLELEVTPHGETRKYQLLRSILFLDDSFAPTLA